MKHLKKIFESEQEITFSDIANIVEDLEDSGLKVKIISADGLPYDLDDRGISSIFKFIRPGFKQKCFSIKVSPKQELDYNQTIDLLESVKPCVARFDDLGFYLYRFWLECNTESDHWSLNSVEYKFEAYK